MTKSTTRKLTRAALLGSASLALTLSAAYAEQAVEFKIESGSLVTALNEYARQSDQEILFSSDIIAGKEAKAVNGVYEPQEALEMILADTGLVYAVDDGDTVLISDPTKVAAAPRTFRVAQVDQESDGTLETVRGGRIDDGDKDDVDTIVVTGTNIRGAAPVGSNIFVLDREAIDLTGLSTTQDVIKSLPQNYGGGPNEATTASGSTASGASFNPGLGAGANLRGLGTDATLTLVNGRRVVGSGFGAFVDLSTIPLSAVERIEVLPDGSSAIYGSDAVGGVVNVILRSDYDGADTRLRFGTVTDGNQKEYQVGQAFGKSWEGGNALLAYEYYNRGELAAEDREFATDDLRPLGGDDFRDIFSNPGNIITGGQFAIPPDQDGTSLSANDLLPGVVNLQDSREGFYILPQQERHSVYLTANQSLAEGVNLFVEGKYAYRDAERRSGAFTRTLTVPSTNPFFVDPVGGNDSVRIRYSFIDDLGASTTLIDVNSYGINAGLDAEVFGDWVIEAYGGYGNEVTKTDNNNRFNTVALAAALADPDPATAFNPFGDGSNTNPNTIESIRGFVMSEFENEQWVANVLANGTLVKIPGGDVKLAFGGEYRSERFRRDQLDFRTTAVPEADPTFMLSRDVFAAFGEVLIPVVGSDNAIPGIRRFEVSVAGRLDDYSDFGSTANPKVGVAWEPFNGLSLRGTYGTSFRPPQLFELNDTAGSVFLFSTVDPTSPTGRTNTIFLTGNNPDLNPEKATTWTAGFDFAPTFWNGFSLNFTFFDVNFKDRLATPDRITGVLPQEELFAPIITRNPDIATVQALFDTPGFLNFLGDDDPANVAAIVDARLNNVAITDIRGFDITAAYSVDTSVGQIGVSLNANHFIDFKEALTSSAPLIEVVDTLNNPANWRLRNSFTWASEFGLRSSAFVNFVDGYVDNISDPERKVASWTTVDLQLAYDFGSRNSNSWFDGVSLSVSAINVFDEDPPFVNNSVFVGFDPENANPQGRFVAFQVDKSW